MAAAIAVGARPDACKRRVGAIRTVCRSPNHLHSATRSASTSRCFAASACTATPDGHQANRPDSPISCTAPSWRSGPLCLSPLHVRVRTSGRHAAARIEGPGSPPPPRTRSGRLRPYAPQAPAPDDPHERRRRAYTPASARGKRASARPRQVLAQIVPCERPTRLDGAVTASWDTSSQGFAAASDECSSGTASDRVPPGACSSSSRNLAITRRTLTIERAKPTVEGRRGVRICSRRMGFLSSESRRGAHRQARRWRVRRTCRRSRSSSSSGDSRIGSRARRSATASEQSGSEPAAR